MHVDPYLNSNKSDPSSGFMSTLVNSFSEFTLDLDIDFDPHNQFDFDSGRDLDLDLDTYTNTDMDTDPGRI